tara:strand:+ start:110 stop:484 length:375 start_codon:yes stop_codon:yes gene_type:complete
VTQKKEKGEKDSGFSEAIKRVVSIGVGAAFMTEDAIKSFLSEFQLPKDIVSGIQKNARSAKAEFLEMIREELSKKFEKVDGRKFLDELLEKYDVEVKATFSFKPKKTDEGQKNEDSSEDTQKSK